MAVLDLHCCTWAFSSCVKQGVMLLLGCTQYLCCMGLVAARHVASSHTRDQTRVLVHWQVGYLPLHHQGSSTQCLLTGHYVC